MNNNREQLPLQPPTTCKVFVRVVAGTIANLTQNKQECMSDHIATMQVQLPNTAAMLQCTEPSVALGLLVVLDAYVICRIVHDCCLVKIIAGQAIGQ